MTVVALGASPLVSGLASANGGSTSVPGGGTGACAEFSTIAGRLIAALAVIGQDKINQTNPFIQVNELIAIKKKPFKCLPASHLDRDAISDPLTVTTRLDQERWNTNKLYNQIRLVAHELAVLAKYESEGEYSVSPDMSALVFELAPYFKYKDKAEQVLISGNEVTFVNPIMVINEIAYPVGDSPNYGYDEGETGTAGGGYFCSLQNLYYKTHMAFYGPWISAFLAKSRIINTTSYTYGSITCLK